MAKSKVSATQLRATLSVIIILTIIMAGVGFYYTQTWLREVALEVNATVAKSTAGSNSSKSSVAELQKAIDERQASVEKANSIMIDSNTFAEKVIHDLDSHASQTGITIADYKFADNTQTTTAATTTPTASVINGVRTIPVTITLGNPVDYNNFLRFIQAIETNLPKMQIGGVSLTSVAGSSNTVTVAPLTIEVFAR